MPENKLSFDHIHILSEDAGATAKWYVEKLGATIHSEKEFLGALQIEIGLAGLTLLIRGRRPGEDPSSPGPMQDFQSFSSHNEYGTDHFGFNYHGDLRAYYETLRAKGVTFVVEPWEISPDTLICYIAAPDGVSIELLQARS